jgi:hypothetical protein
MTAKTVILKIGNAEIILDKRDLKIDLSALWIDCEGYVRLGRKKRLHRIIINAPPDMDVDHRNRNPLDNRRSNLRICTPAQNARNRPKPKNNTTGEKGVDYQKRQKSYRARIMADNQSYYLGNFDNPSAAGAAYRQAAKLHHGEFRYKEPKPRKKKQ